MNTYTCIHTWLYTHNTHRTHYTNNTHAETTGGFGEGVGYYRSGLKVTNLTLEY